jgi:hypothetical protein
VCPYVFQLAASLFRLAAVLAMLADRLRKVVLGFVDAIVTTVSVRLQYPSARNHHDRP